MHGKTSRYPYQFDTWDYTQDFGKATYIAKSVRKQTSRQASHLDILSLVDFGLAQKSNHSRILQSGPMPIIKSACSLNNFANLKGDIKALALANFVLEIFDRLIFENDRDEHLWNFFNSKLILFDQSAGKVDVDWLGILDKTTEEALIVLGYNENISFEEIIGDHLNSLLFARKMLE